MKRLGIFVGLLLFIAACGGSGDGDEELTLTEYFQRIEVASDESDRRMEELQQAFDAATANARSSADVIAPTGDFIDGTSESISDFLAALRSIDPPGAVEDTHDAAFLALDDMLEAWEEARGGGIESVADLEAFFGDTAIGEAAERVDETCNELQAVAAANDIEVKLNCEG